MNDDLENEAAYSEEQEGSLHKLFSAQGPSANIFAATKPWTPPGNPAQKTPKVYAFSGHKNYLSNFYTAPTLFEGVIYPTAEHAFQAAKTTDKEARKVFASHKDALRAKTEGKLLTLRPDWDIIKLNTMLEIVRNKFERNSNLGQMLVATGDERLVHENYWRDTYWGTYNGQGSNHLGEILMIVRDELSGNTKQRMTIGEGDFLV